MHESSSPIVMNVDAVAVESGENRLRIIAQRLQQAALVALQLTGLWALNFAGVWVVQKAGLPIPGNLVGMLALYALLTLGVVKVAWFDLTGSFLIKHLAFFFVPITVGLMDSGPLLLARGVGVMVVLTVSAGFGILLAGFVSQALLTRTWRRGERL